jgi:VanZ family protein
VAGALAIAPSARHDALVATGLLAYGALIEVAQMFVPGRTASLADVVADAVGIALGLVLARVWRRLAVPANRPRAPG